MPCGLGACSAILDFYERAGNSNSNPQVSEQALTPSEPPSHERPSPGRADYSVVVRKANRQQQGRNFPLAPIFCFSRWSWHWGLGPRVAVMKDNLTLHSLFLNAHWVLGTESFIRSFLFGLSSWKLDKVCHILGDKACLTPPCCLLSSHSKAKKVLLFSVLFWYQFSSVFTICSRG